jgi:beta-N-acetylhexosaminidase
MNSTRFVKYLSVVVLGPLLFYVLVGYKSKNSTLYEYLTPANEWVENELIKMTLEEKIGQFFMVAAYSNREESHLKEVEDLVIKEKVGGIIFFQGERSNLKTAINRFQAKAKIPLLIGMDAEWGVQMRLFGEERFPYAYTIGAADDVELTERIAAMMAQECREIGIHINFAPDADVNSNPDNPVIGFRSFGENPRKVAGHVAATVRGMEQNGVMTSIKHFPGHGNTDTDSHLELPKVNQSLKTIQAIDFYPFREGIHAGASTVMVAHLNVPALDKSGTPSSLSKRVIKGYLQDTLGFKGLVVSDALNMKAVADRYGKTEVVVRAFEAGCDILLFPESVHDAIEAIAKKVQEGKISKLEIDTRCRKVLLAKHKFILTKDQFKEYTPGEVDWAKKETYEKALTVLKNEGDLLPLGRLDRKIARISIGLNSRSLLSGIQRFAKIDQYHFYTVEEAVERMKGKLKNYDVIITALHANSVRPKNEFGFPSGWKSWLELLPTNKKHVLLLFGNPLALTAKLDLKKIQSVVVAYENHPLVLDRASQLVFGAIPANGKLPISVSGQFPLGAGKEVKWGGRLKYSQPEELGINPSKLKDIDQLAKNGIEKGAYPGCQVLFAVEGKIVYYKCFGTHTYDDSIAVKETDIYDIASVTKIAASTSAIMKLQTDGKFSLNRHLEDYIPEVTGYGEFGNILLRDMLTHQAGLKSWIPFYARTVANGSLNPAIYSMVKKPGFEVEVAKNMWIKNSYTDTIYKQILASRLGSKKYEYSDLGYYFIKKIVEKQSLLPLDSYVQKELYDPMGLQYLSYLPLRRFPVTQIVPTENDLTYRKQLIAGYVHDPGAAMMGGVGGHAGIFSNATDLASIMQLFLNKGTYGNYRYIDESVINEYTSCQFAPSNRRGVGFDKPTLSLNGGPTCSEVSLFSYGHTGFTGTMAWADPQAKINYVFLSNRIYPDASNKKLIKMDIRTDIQRVIYEAVSEAKNKK